MSQSFNHVLIHGVGLLGASLGLALKKHRLAHTITGVGRANSPSLSIAQSRHAIDHASTDLASAVPAADLVILCTPIRQFPAAFQTLAPALRPGTIVTDVGSTKSDVCRWASELLPPHVHFIGSHPMAGSEKSGPQAARDNLYHNAVCLLCPPASAESQPAFARIRHLWSTLGMRLIELMPDVHDRWVATISHLPHAVAFALVNAASHEPKMLEAVAGGFLDTTRVASSDVSMWTDIFLTNRAAVLASLDVFSADLAALRDAIAAENEPALRDILTRAKRSRDDLLARRQAAGLSIRSPHTPPSKDAE
jgi:prephenate dehydrogenase